MVLKISGTAKFSPLIGPEILNPSTRPEREKNDLHQAHRTQTGRPANTMKYHGLSLCVKASGHARIPYALDNPLANR
jgi:hypothetical protein